MTVYQLSGDDWAVIGIAGGVATAIATLASLFFSLLWRLVDRQRAAWVLFDGHSRWTGLDPYSDQASPPIADAELANVGDGLALAVRIVGIGCTATLRGDDMPHEIGFGSWRPALGLVPAMRSGDQVHVSVVCGALEWDQAELAVTWRPSPSLLGRRRVERVPLRSIAERPRYTPLVEVDGLHEHAERPMPPPDQLVKPTSDVELAITRGPLRRWQLQRELRQS